MSALMRFPQHYVVAQEQKICGQKTKDEKKKRKYIRKIKMENKQCFQKIEKNVHLGKERKFREKMSP